MKNLVGRQEKYGALVEKKEGTKRDSPDMWMYQSVAKLERISMRRVCNLGVEEGRYFRKRKEIMRCDLTTAVSVLENCG
jgi:hypothetical protein